MLVDLVLELGPFVASAVVVDFVVGTVVVVDNAPAVFSVASVHQVAVVGSVVEVDIDPAASSVASVAQVRLVVVDTALAYDSIPTMGGLDSFCMGSSGSVADFVAVGFLVMAKKEDDVVSVAIQSHVLDSDP